MEAIQQSKHHSKTKKMTRERNIFEILSILDRKNKPLTSKEITDDLNDLGIPLTGRMVRNYLQRLDEKGFTENLGKQGRRITEKGRDELKNSFVYARKDFIFDLVGQAVMDARFDLNRQRGELITSLAMIKEDREDKVRGILEELCTKTKLFSPLVKIAHSGERICNREVPEGMFGLAVICGVAVDQILFNNGIFMHFGDAVILELEDHKPVRCIDFVSGSGVSFDPWELFIENKLVHVYDCVIRGRGGVLAECCQVPYTVRARVIGILRKVVDIIGGTVIVGGYGDNLLGVPTKLGYFGLLIVAADSLMEALEAKGIKTNYETITPPINFKELEPIAPVRGEVLLL